MATEISYNSATVGFNQESCHSCSRNFTQDERIMELACKHLFHKRCYNELYWCTQCYQPIEGRVSPWEQLEENLTGLIEFLMGFYILSLYKPR